MPKIEFIKSFLASTLAAQVGRVREGRPVAWNRLFRLYVAEESNETDEEEERHEAQWA